MAVLIKDSQKSLKTDKKRIKTIIEDLPIFSGLQDKDLSLLFVDNRKIKSMNKRWFGKDKPTNVISFSYIESSSLPPPFECGKSASKKDDQSRDIIGDIIISVERAKEEAEKAARPFYERLFALAIHGLLHILGFDHKGEIGEARRMKYREQKLLGYVRKHPLYKDLVPGNSDAANNRWLPD